MFIAFIFIPGLATAFFLMPYFEVGKSRRYADRRLGISVSMLFIALMWISNWMGSPISGAEPPDQEVAQELLPQEGHSALKEVPYEFLEPGTYTPFDAEDAPNPYLAAALEEFERAMQQRSCSLSDDGPYEPCQVMDQGDTVRYGNRFTNDAMPDPEAQLIIDDYQDNMRRLTLVFPAPDLEPWQ